jgi:catechol 2,3-dioxygenase-like lactoylglutathione lyase family enzyme
LEAEYVPFFHVGVLVRDIDQAAEDFGKLLGLRFEPVRSAPLVSGELMRFCYSLQGPPYLELVQMAGTSLGIWGPEQGEGLHHLAFADPDVPGSCAAFGGQADMVVGGGEGGSARVVFTRPEALHGIRVEYLVSPMVTATFERLRAAAGLATCPRPEGGSGGLS